MTIDIQQPRSYDIVGSTIQIAGLAGEAFEASFSYRIHEGHDEVTGHFMAGDGVGGHGQFQLSVDVSGAAFSRECLSSSRCSTPHPRTAASRIWWSRRCSVPSSCLANQLPGARRQPGRDVNQGETLWTIAMQYYGNGNLYHRLVAANPLVITNPNVIHVGDVLGVPRS